jgi:hypothetical protein
MRSHSKALLAALVFFGLVSGPLPADIGKKPAFKIREPSDETKQRRTIAEMRNLGTALFCWLTDEVGAGAAGAKMGEVGYPVDLAAYPPITEKELTDLLVPQYLAKVPTADAWGHPYEVRVNVKDVLAEKVLLIRSPGRDGVYSGQAYEIRPIPPESYDEDLVWADGYFVRWPQRQN